MEIREVYRSGDVFHLNVTGFPPHLQRFVVFSTQVDPPYSFITSAGVGPPYKLAKLDAGERCKLNPQLFGCLTLTRPILVGCMVC